MKKYKNGLVIGKFLPFHKGHESLIEEAQKNVEKLTVIVCDTKGYTIPAAIRKQWIHSRFPELDIRILRHKPYLDSTFTDISKEWAEITKKFLKFVPDVIYSSENYGEVYAKYMGSKHVLYDLHRKKYPISATEIRNNPYKHWDMIGEDVRAFYCKRIVVLGAESTGTTTLAKDLANYYKTTWVPEYGRTYYEGKLFSENANKWDTDEFIHIAKQQNTIEDYLAKKCNRVLICDTDSFTTGMWHLRYVGKKSPLVEKISEKRKYDLYIITDVDIPFVQDGTRDGEHLRNWMHKEFINYLSAGNKPYIVVSGAKEVRLKEAVDKIDKLLSC